MKIIPTKIFYDFKKYSYIFKNSDIRKGIEDGSSQPSLLQDHQAIWLSFFTPCFMYNIT